MVSKLMFWGGKNGAFRQTIFCCGEIDDIDRKLSKSHYKSAKRFKYLTIAQKRFLIRGYIRKHAHNKIYFIDGIIDICFQYYHVLMDKWDVANSSKYLRYTKKNSRRGP
eukprot:831248_1